MNQYFKNSFSSALGMITGFAIGARIIKWLDKRFVKTEDKPLEK